MDNEEERLSALRAFCVLDTAPDERFDRITELVADLFDAPIALVSLVDRDRQWFKSRQGLDATETHRDLAFCAHVLPLGRDGLLVVEDATQDPRFAENALVTGGPLIRFYIGAALTTDEGCNLGTLCVIDTKPRPRPSERQIKQLRALARIVVDELELGRTAQSLTEQKRLLQLAEAMSGVGHWRYDLSRQNLVWSDEVYRIHGLDRASFTPSVEVGVNFYHPDDQPVIAALIQRAVVQGVGFDCQLRIQRRDGEIRYITSRAACDLDASGATTAISGVFQDITAHVLAVEDARLNEGRYKLLADSLGDVVMRIPLNGERGYVSPSVERLLGFTPAEMAQAPLETFVHPDDRKVVASIYERLLQAPQSVTTRYRALKKDGDFVWVELNAQLVFDEAGAPLELVAVARDISERQALEQETIHAREVAEDEARRAAMAERITGLGHWRLDIATKALTWSEQTYAIYGLDPTTPVTLDLAMSMTHPEDRSGADARIARNFAAQGLDDRTLFRIIRPDGAVRYVTGDRMAERDETGAVTALVGAMMDVTERHEAALAIRESEARYRLLAENVTDMIVTTDLNGRVTYASPSCELVMGYGHGELLTLRPIELTHPDDAPEVLRVFGAVAKGRSPERVRWRAQHKDHPDWIWLESMPARLSDPQTGAPSGFLDVIRDATQQVAQEQALASTRAEAEAAAAVKSEFLANMSHEIRTPLTAVLGFSSLLAQRNDLDELARLHVHRVASASQALLSIVNDVLDFSKLEAGQFEITPRPASPAQVARDALAMFTPQAEAKSIWLECEIADDIPDYVLLDPERIRQILLNLVGNAVKFTEVGSVRLGLSYDHPGQKLRIEVEDTGPGLTEAAQAKLFQRFSQVDGSTTRKHGGTGLGLAICKGLSEAMGGEIGVTSILGQGSIFFLQIPAPITQPQPAAQGADAPPTSLDGIRVLVVDDNSINRELARALLEAVGAEVSEAEDGESGVELASFEPVDVILLDIHMPGMGGVEALALIRAEPGPNQDIPILAFSADFDLTGLGETHDFNGVVRKPITPMDLIRAVSQCMEWTPGSEQLEQADAAA